MLRVKFTDVETREEINSPVFGTVFDVTNRTGGRTLFGQVSRTEDPEVLATMLDADSGWQIGARLYDARVVQVAEERE
jgi:hypothetical protein